MANPEHLEILKQGYKMWNQWRKDNPHIRPDLSEAWLDKAHLNNFSFINADLTNANLRMARFYLGNLIRADLTGKVYPLPQGEDSCEAICLAAIILPKFLRFCRV